MYRAYPTAGRRGGGGRAARGVAPVAHGDAAGMIVIELLYVLGVVALFVVLSYV